MENQSPAHVATEDASNPTRPHKQGPWSNSEHQLFLQALQLYSKDWRKIASHVQTRSPSQVRSHAQKYFNKLEFDRQRIGANSQAIIDNQADQIATRARVSSRGPKKHPQREDDHGEDHEEDRGDVHTVSMRKMKKIPKDEKEMKKSPKSKMKQSIVQERIISPQVPLRPIPIYPSSQWSEQQGHYGMRSDYVQGVNTDQAAQNSIGLLNGSNRRAPSKGFKRYVRQQSTELPSPSPPIPAQEVRPSRQQQQQNQDEQLPQGREASKTKKIEKGRKGKRRANRKALETIIEQQENNSPIIVKDQEAMVSNEPAPIQTDPRSYFTANVADRLENMKGKNGKIPPMCLFSLIQGTFKRYSTS